MPTKKKPAKTELDVTHIEEALRPLAVAIDSVSIDPANVREHPDQNLEAIKASLRRFGQQRPVLVDQNGVVVAGNGTLRAMRELGHEHVAVVRTSLTGSDRTAYAIADNRLTELGGWTTELADALAALRSDDDIDELLTGFTDKDIDELLVLTDADPKREPGSGGDGPTIAASWSVMVECASESDQQKVFEQMTSQGYTCKVLTM